MATQRSSYPANLRVDYPDRPLNRLTTFFRLITAIPIFIVLVFLLGDSGAGFLFGATLLMILFRLKYPRWWYDWNFNVLKFQSRVTSYLFLLRDEYPATDEDQAVHVQLEYPDVPNDLNRWLPLIKWLLAIPHYIVLFFLGIGAIIAIFIAWLAILFTGRYPQGLFNYVVGVMRWSMRVQAYAIILVTDRYPPFSLSE